MVDEASSVTFDYSGISTLKDSLAKSTENGEISYDYAYEISASAPMVISVADGAESVTLTIYVSHNRISTARTVYIGTDATSTSGENVIGSLTVGGDGNADIDYLQELTVTLAAGETYYIWSSDVMHLYGLTVTYTAAG